MFRAKGFFSIYMTLGGSLLIALSLLLAILALGRRTARLLIPTALAFTVLGLTYVRNAWLGLAVAIVLLTALTRRARLFVGGDTGPVHLAAAQNIPVVAIYGPTNPQRNGPYGPQGPNGGRIVVLRSPESQTSHARRAAPESGLLQITVDDVFSAACRLIGGCS